MGELRPRPPRVRFDGLVKLWAGDRQVICRAVNLSWSGALLRLPTTLIGGPAIRVQLLLPAPNRWVELAAVRVREIFVEARCAWGIRFLEAAPEVESALRRFVLGELADERVVPRGHPAAAKSEIELQTLYRQALAQLGRQQGMELHAQPRRPRSPP